MKVVSTGQNLSAGMGATVLPACVGKMKAQVPLKKPHVAQTHFSRWTERDSRQRRAAPVSAIKDDDAGLELAKMASIDMGVEDLFTDSVDLHKADDSEYELFSSIGHADLHDVVQASFEEAAMDARLVSSNSNATVARLSAPVETRVIDDPSGDVLLPTYSGLDLDTGIVHFGVGGFFRSHQMVYMDYLMRHDLQQNKKWGYTGVGVLPADQPMKEALESQEYMYTVIAHSASSLPDEDAADTCKENIRVVAALKDMLLAHQTPGELMRRLTDENTKIYSLTITEFGYTVPTAKADLALLELAQDADEELSWGKADKMHRKYLGATAIGYIVAGLSARRCASTGGVTVMSCDNIPGNGDYIREKVLQRAEAAGGGLKEWIEFNCTFPNSMVDRITPITSDSVKHKLAVQHGIKDNWPVACETFSQWVIEDNFAEGISSRPRWEDVGVQMVQDVKPYELAKIRMLNVIHSVMVFPALLMGLEYIHEAATHPLTKAFYTYVMQEEMAPTLRNIDGIEAVNLDVYQDILVERFSNILVADTLMRVAQDTSNKFSIQGQPATQDGIDIGLKMEGMAFMVACWGHFIRKCKRANVAINDQKAALIEAAMADDDINHLLDMEPIFHELIFCDTWRSSVNKYYEMIKLQGIRRSLKNFNISRC